MSVEPYAVDAIEKSVSQLIESGKSRGYLTWEELNESRPSPPAEEQLTPVTDNSASCSRESET